MFFTALVKMFIVKVLTLPIAICQIVKVFIDRPPGGSPI